MKKKKFLFTILIFAMGCALYGCSGGTDKEENESQTEVQTQSQNESGNQDEQIEENAKNQVSVYFGNADATAFETKDIEIESLAPQSVLGALVSQGTLTADVDMLSFSIKTVDNKDSIELNLNKAFATYLSNMDTSAEYYAVGAVCNTFLEAYDCDQIKITVEGDDLSTTHAEYPGYLARFE
uniref:GerMN domain-containing protein n=1 Tax=Lachnoclostridium phocaeense TaxID=1871021 RepID=UPI0026DB5DD9|nr:GerMN domain-containing protein [Lachnoclostridium phocaeense]